MHAERMFAEVVLVDPTWLAAEFDAIVAANFGAGAPHADARPRPPLEPPRAHSCHVARPSRTARQVGARQRSPPGSDTKQINA